MSEKHYLAYHTPTQMKYGGSKVNIHVLSTSKEAEARAAARDGATVWLIGREEGDSRVYWYGWLKAQTWKVTHFPELNFNGELHGDPAVSRLRPLDDGEPVLLDSKPWLKGHWKCWATVRLVFKHYSACRSSRVWKSCGVPHHG